MDTGIWSCSEYVREHWQRGQSEVYGSGTDRIDKGFIWWAEKMRRAKGRIMPQRMA